MLAVAVAGDRSSRAEQFLWSSVLRLLSCGKRGPVGCVGGQVDHAWVPEETGSWSALVSHRVQLPPVLTALRTASLQGGRKHAQEPTEK